MPINKLVYHPEWSDRIRPDALKAANYQCQTCRAPSRMLIIRDSNGDWLEVDETVRAWANAQGVKVFMVKLSVCHLNHITTDNRPENLRVMCQLHHAQHDAGHKVAMRRFTAIVDVDELLAMTKNGPVDGLFPQLLRVYRAKRREVLQLQKIYDNARGRKMRGPYPGLIKGRIEVVDGSCTYLLQRIVEHASAFFNIPDGKGFADKFVHREDVIIGSKPSKRPFFPNSK